MDCLSHSTDLTELIDFLNDDWERRESDPVEELAEDLGAFLQEGGELTMPLSAILNSVELSVERSVPCFTIR